MRVEERKAGIEHLAVWCSGSSALLEEGLDWCFMAFSGGSVLAGEYKTSSDCKLGIKADIFQHIKPFLICKVPAHLN